MSRNHERAVTKSFNKIMRNIASYVLSLLGALIALFSSGFYVLFTETIRIKEFWIGLLLFLLALLGAISIFFIHKRPVATRINFFIAGIGGIFSLLYLVGYSPVILDGTFFNKPTLLYFSGYIFFLLAALAIGKQKS